jgi:protein CLEC16A
MSNSATNRVDILLFFQLRRLHLSVTSVDESELPLAAPMQLQKIGSKLDLNNSDLIGCTVKRDNAPAERRFLVVDVYQLILVEPDSSRLGWGVVTFAGPLQDLEIEQSSRDNRALSVRIRSTHSRSRSNQTTQLLIFDDHIRSLAARQRLTKGRLRARHLKLQKIAAILDLPANFLQDPFASSSSSYSHSSNNPIKGANAAGSSIARRPGHAKMSQIFHYGVIDQQPEKATIRETTTQDSAPQTAEQHGDASFTV